MSAATGLMKSPRPVVSNQTAQVTTTRWRRPSRSTVRSYVEQWGSICSCSVLA